MPSNDSDQLGLSRRKLLGSVATVGAAGAIGGAGTMAIFRDEENYANNQLVAGELDLKVAASHHYVDWLPDTDTSGVSKPTDPIPSPQETDDAEMPDGDTPDIRLNPGSAGGGDTAASPIELVLVDDADGNGDDLDLDGDGDVETDGTDDDEPALEFAVGSKVNDINGGVPPGSYGKSLCDIKPGGDDDDVGRPVVDLEDVKPGDFGLIRFAFASCDNPAFVSFNADVTARSENGTTEPEADDPDEESDVVELLDEVQVALIDDDVYQLLANLNSGKTVVADPQATLRDLENGFSLAAEGDIPAEEGGGAPGARNCFSGKTNHRYTLVWWLPVDHANEIQSDSAEFNVGITAEQCRHNDGSVTASITLDDQTAGGSVPLPSGNQSVASVTVANATYNGVTDPLFAKPLRAAAMARGSDPDQPHFVLGLHDPEVGSGQANKRNSLIGVAPFPTGSYGRVTVPVFETQFTAPNDADFPPSGDTDVTATLWHGPKGQYTGPIVVDGDLVQDTATITF